MVRIPTTPQITAFLIERGIIVAPPRLTKPPMKFAKLRYAKRDSAGAHPSAISVIR